MKKDQGGFGVLAVLMIVAIIGLVALVGSYVISKRSQPNSAAGTVTTSEGDAPTNMPKIVTKTYCSDVCPQNTRTFQVYDGIDSQAACEAIHGQTIKDAAWGAYIGCGAKAPGEASEVKE